IPHPVILIGKWIHRLERWLTGGNKERAAHRSAPAVQRTKGILLTAITVVTSFMLMWAMLEAARLIHPWLGYAVNTWFISTTIAIKGLKDAAIQVYEPLQAGRIEEARTYTGYIVGRDTDRLDESE